MTTEQTLTVRQEQVLGVIQGWITRFGYPPTLREIGGAVGLVSSSSVRYQVRELERKGYLRRDARRVRAIGVVAKDAPSTERTPGQVRLVVTVDVDPVWHGHDIPQSEVEEIVVAAIDARRGLHVAESSTVVPS